MSEQGTSKLPWRRMSLEISAALFTILSVLPQLFAMKNHGTLGISSAWMLNFFLFSTTQLSIILLDDNTVSTIEKTYKGGGHGFHVLSTLFGFSHVFIHWLSSCILLHYYVHSSRDDSHHVLNALPQDSSRYKVANLSTGMSPRKMITISTLYAIVVLIPAAMYVNRPPTKSIGARYVGDHIARQIVQLPLLFLLQMLNIVFTSSTIILQLRDILSAPQHQALSTSFLLLQGLDLVILGLVQLFRPWMPYRVDAKEAAWTYVWWYTQYAAVAVSYLIMAVGFGISLDIRVLS